MDTVTYKAFYSGMSLAAVSKSCMTWPVHSFKGLTRGTAMLHTYSLFLGFVGYLENFLSYLVSNAWYHFFCVSKKGLQLIYRAGWEL